MNEFTDFTTTKGNFRVTWEDIGEGWEGDYDPSDPEDDQLLRFSCDKLVNGEWEQVPDGSYCTRCPITTPKDSLELFANSILEACEQPSPKRRLEELSWLSPEDDFTKKSLAIK